MAGQLFGGSTDLNLLLQVPAYELSTKHSDVTSLLMRTTTYQVEINANQSDQTAAMMTTIVA